MRRRKRIEASSHVGTAPETEPDEPVPYALTPLAVAWLERDFATRDRVRQLRAFEALDGELVGDLFAGGGGASTGIAAALGRAPDFAINHDPEAIAVHRANHPDTRHYLEDIEEVDPRAACAGRPLGLLWLSPDCTHHSRAKGGKPRSAKIRSLAWAAVRWAREARPRVIVLENVEEFADWGPLDDEGHPIAAQRGDTFREWLAALTGSGYAVEFRSIVAADFGAPTTRRRLFLVARRDGQRAAWPEPTHGAGRAEAWRPAAEIIDWSLPCPSIFLSRAEGRALGVNRPLAEATLRRIAAGVRRYVLEAAEPFIVPCTHHGDSRVHGLGEPLRTVTAAHRGELALIAPTLVQTGYGERVGQAPRTLDLAGRPLGTVVNGQKHALVAAFMNKHFARQIGRGCDSPLSTITARDHNSLTTARLEPLPMDRSSDVRAFLTKFYGTSTAAPAQQPLPTITASGKGGGHLGIVYVLGEAYEIADIGLRMLSPRELFRAQGFADDYEIDPVYAGRALTKTAQIRLAGNSVCPPVAQALVAANVLGGAARAA